MRALELLISILIVDTASNLENIFEIIYCFSKQYFIFN